MSPSRESSQLRARVFHKRRKWLIASRRPHLFPYNLLLLKAIWVCRVKRANLKPAHIHSFGWVHSFTNYRIVPFCIKECSRFWWKKKYCCLNLANHWQQQMYLLSMHLGKNNSCLSTNCIQLPVSNVHIQQPGNWGRPQGTACSCLVPIRLQLRDFYTRPFSHKS